MILGCFCVLVTVSFIAPNTPTPDKLLSLFKDTSFTRSQVEARYDNKGLVKGFRDLRLPEEMYSLFDYTDEKKQKQSLHKEWFYLIGNKFNVSSTTIGLTLFGSDDKFYTSTKLYVWDIETKKVKQVVNLADGFSEEGSFTNSVSWLEDVNNDKKIDIVTIGCNDDEKAKKGYSIFSNMYIFNGNIYDLSKQKVNIAKYPFKCR
jgi:hypothetical protein